MAKTVYSWVPGGSGYNGYIEKDRLPIMTLAPVHGAEREHDALARHIVALLNWAEGHRS